MSDSLCFVSIGAERISATVNLSDGLTTEADGAIPTDYLSSRKGPVIINRRGTWAGVSRGAAKYGQPQVGSGKK